MKKINFNLPKLGMRTVKTAICVAICLVISLNFRTDIALYSSFAAIVCMQSTVENTLKTGLNRLVGTAIGGGTGILFLLFLGASLTGYFYFILLPLGIIAVIYMGNAIKMPTSTTICAIAFLSVFASPLPDTNPYIQAIYRIEGTLIGVVVATLVNRFIVPAQLKEPKNIPAKKFDSLYKSIQPHLSGKETLLLFVKKTDLSWSLQKNSTSNKNVTVPIPLSLCMEKIIRVACVTPDLQISFLALYPHEGFVTIPEQVLPCTVYWNSK